MRRSADWFGSGAGVVRRVVWASKSGVQAMCILRLFRASNCCEHRIKAVLDLKFIVGLGRHKEVFDKRASRG